MPFLHSISEEAKSIGAVNCIKVSNGETIGFNTDALGFEESLKPLLKPFHKNALVLGNGGAAKAAVFVLAKLGINAVIVSRNPHKNMLHWSDLSRDTLAKNLLIINCTPIGMQPNEKDLVPLNYEFITDRHILYDLIYKPLTTRFLQEGQRRGATVKNGMEMLELQAEKNWEIWNS